MGTVIIIIVLLFIFCLVSGERQAKKALESERIFYPFDDSIHSTKPQQDRIKRAIEQDIRVKNLLTNGYSGKIIGTSGNVYLVTLKNCTCQDFKRRQKPCKHMYFLAAQTLRCNIFEVDGTYYIEKI